MTFSVQMPALGESVTEGTVTRWLKQEGDTVAVDEPLVEVSTDKVDTEIPSPVAGVLQKIVAAEDETVEVGGQLAIIGDSIDTAGSDAPSDAPAAVESSRQSEAEAPSVQAPDAAPAAPGGGSPVGTSITMPALGESVTEGTVTRWLKAVGDEVAVDEPLVEVSTDKVDTEIPSPVAGTLLEISAGEDETIEVGGQLAVIGVRSAVTTPTPTPRPREATPALDDSVSASPGGGATGNSATTAAAPTPLEVEAAEDAAARGQAAAVATRTPAPPQPETPALADPGRHRGNEAAAGAPYVTPLVRKLAAQHGVDLMSVTGTGVGGRIRKQDVDAAAAAATSAAATSAAAASAAAASAAAAAPTAPAATTLVAPTTDRGVRPELQALRGTTQKASRIRQITATKTRESLQTTAQLTQTFEVDMSRVAALRTRAKAQFSAREGVNLTFLPFFAKAVVESLKLHPNVNASYDEAAKEITYHGQVHLSIAVDTPAGLLSPVISNAGDLSLAGLARSIADLAARARSNGLKPDELSGGTFTITNIGSQGALFDTPILVPPQAAMLGTGAILKRPVVVTDALGGDTIAIRSMCYLPLTYDHRLVDGADAGRFLTTLKHRLEEAAFEADLGL